MVGSLTTRATEAVDGHYFLASSVLLGASGVLSGIVDNIPYVATMAPLVGAWSRPATAPLAPTRPGGRSPWRPTSVGMRRAVGASANVAVLGIAAANGHPISF